jgi:hypothetical protein
MDQPGQTRRRFIDAKGINAVFAAKVIGGKPPGQAVHAAGGEKEGQKKSKA